MSNILIRPLRAADHDAWLRLWKGYNAFYGRSGATALAPEITATLWQRLLKRQPPFFALIAEMDSTVVGLAHCLFHPSTSCLAESCYLQDLFTAESVRGRGIATRLIEAVYEEAAKAGAGRVYWQTHETSLSAQRVYDRVGERSGFIVYRHLL